MENTDDILARRLSEQLALEEQVCRTLEDLISDIDEASYSDAKALLTKTTEVLQGHFTLLNELLGKFEKDAFGRWTKVVAGNGGGFSVPSDRDQTKERVSKILRDAYSALNSLAMSNTQLYTAALALSHKEVAAIALKHLENLAHLVVKIGQIAPNVVARELLSESPKIDLGIAQTALNNIQLAWQKVL